MTNETLKNCPFCAGEASFSVGTSNQGIGFNMPMEYIECLDCSASTSMFQKQKDAIPAWNTRTTDANYEKLLAFVKKTASYQCVPDFLYKTNDVQGHLDEAEKLLREIGE